MALVLAVAVAGIAATAGSTRATERSGELHVTKECGQYDPVTAGSFCTITSSNINAIRKQMRVVYASAADLTAGVLDSDLVVDGPGRNDAFGHVVLDLQAKSGVVTLDGGTGRFAHFHAAITVACPKFPELCTWDGPYSFVP
jgi:hypothetical protein